MLTVCNSRLYEWKEYQISESSKEKVQHTIVTVKKLHYNNNQGGDKNPMMLKDLQHIIISVPEVNFERYMSVSLFLLAFHTC